MAEVQVVAVPEPQPVIINVRSLTKDEERKLRRWEKFYKMKEDKRAKQRKHIEITMDIVLYEARRRPNTTGEDILNRLYRTFKKEGWNPKLIGLEAQKELYMTLQVGVFYLDLIELTARTETIWTSKGITVEVLGELTQEDLN